MYNIALNIYLKLYFKKYKQKDLVLKHFKKI